MRMDRTRKKHIEFVYMLSGLDGVMFIPTGRSAFLRRLWCISMNCLKLKIDDLRSVFFIIKYHLMAVFHPNVSC